MHSFRKVSWQSSCHFQHMASQSFIFIPKGRKAFWTLAVKKMLLPNLWLWGAKLTAGPSCCTLESNNAFVPKSRSHRQRLRRAETLRQGCAGRHALLWCADLAICLAETLLELHYRLRLSLHRFLSFPLSSMSIRPMSRSEHSPSLFWVSIFLQMTFFSKRLTCLYLSNIYLSEDPNYCKERQEAVSKTGSGTKSLTVGPGGCYSEERRARRVARTWYTLSTDDFTEVTWENTPVERIPLYIS